MLTRSPRTRGIIACSCPFRKASPSSHDRPPTHHPASGRPFTPPRRRSRWFRVRGEHRLDLASSRGSGTSIIDNLLTAWYAARALDLFSLRLTTPPREPPGQGRMDWRLTWLVASSPLSC